MKAVVSIVLLMLVFTAGLLFTASCDDDDDDDGGASMDDVCDDLGPLPVESGTMTGRFNFGDGDGFPLTIELEAGSQTWSAWVAVTDASETFEGECSGQWDDDGVMTGSCLLLGSFALDVSLDGEVGNKAACGDWENQVGQSGDWWVQR